MLQSTRMNPWKGLRSRLASLGIAGWLIVLSGLILRAWSLRFGLPFTESRPDETTLVRVALKFGSGDLNPHFFNYPSFMMYVMFVLDGLYFAVGRVAGWFHSPA